MRSIGAASTWIILARAAQIPIGESWVVPLQVLALTAGLIAVAKWLASQAYGEAGSFWRYGFAALAVHAAVIGLPEAVVGYGVVYFLGGSLLGFSSISRTRPRWMLAGAALLIAGLPLTPSWAVSAGFELSFWPAGLFAMVITAGFIDGYIRYSFARLGEAEVVESGIGALTFLGLVLLMVALVFIGLVPVVSGGLPHGSWWAGFLVAALVGLMMAFRRRALPAPHISLHFLERVFSFTWFYRSLWRGFQAAGRGFRLMSSLLEGEAAVLWALVMLALLVSLFSQIGFGG